MCADLGTDFGAYTRFFPNSCMMYSSQRGVKRWYNVTNESNKLGRPQKATLLGIKDKIR